MLVLRATDDLKRSVIAPTMATAVAATGAAMKTSPERTIR